jgi:hypothetical protein
MIDRPRSLALENREYHWPQRAEIWNTAPMIAPQQMGSCQGFIRSRPRKCC